MRFVRAFVTAVLLAGVAVVPAHGVSSNDLYADEQWNLDVIGADAAWRVGTGHGATIAVIDTGVDLDHEDLASKVVRHVSCIGADDDPSKCNGSGHDDHGHGSHVAGIAAAITGNGRGIAGTAPGAEIMAVRVMEADPATGGASGSLSDIRAGIRWAADQGADVINLSLGETNFLFKNIFGSGLSSAIDYAWDKGSIPVIAAGNLNSLFGSGYDALHVVVVTATNPDDEQASYATDTGATRWPMAAPGGESNGQSCAPNNPEACEPLILSAWLQDGPDESAYRYAQGTSMAAPHVAGAAAVLRSLGLSPEETVDRLLETAKDIGREGRDSQTGYGRLDLAAAVAGLQPSGHPIPPESTTTTTPPPTLPAPPSTERVEVRGQVSGRAPVPPSTARRPTTTDAPTSTTEPPAPVEDVPVASAPPAPPGPSSDLGPWPAVAAILIVVVGAGVRHTRMLLFDTRR